MLQLVYVEQVVPVDFAELGAGGFSTALLAPVDDRSEFELLALVQRLFLFIELNLLSVDGTCLQRFQGGYINFRLSLLSQLDHLMLARIDRAVRSWLLGGGHDARELGVYDHDGLVSVLTEHYLIAGLGPRAAGLLTRSQMATLLEVNSRQLNDML